MCLIADCCALSNLRDLDREPVPLLLEVISPDQAVVADDGGPGWLEGIQVKTAVAARSTLTGSRLGSRPSLTPRASQALRTVGTLISQV